MIEAGARLTCVDASPAMLEVLSRKLNERGCTAEILCRDIEQISFDGEYDLAVLPFQSFMELIGEEKQVNTLRCVYRALVPGGRFFCTMHNPTVRRGDVNGTFRALGSFPVPDGTLVVSGFETGGEPIVSRSQFFEYFDQSGKVVWKKLLRMEFQFMEREQFEGMAVKAGFVVRALYGCYDRSEFRPSTSPVMIWELERPLRPTRAVSE